MAGRITLSTAVRTARRIHLSLSTSVKPWGRIPQSIKSLDLSTSIKPKSRWSTNKCRSIHSMKDRHDFCKLGYTVDVADLLSTPERDFLVKANGQKVPVSSLKGKLVGLYFCQNGSHPPHREAIKKVYEEAKSRGYDFEIVQISLHYRSLKADDFGTEFYDDNSWLTLPFMDPGCLKIHQLVFDCIADRAERWRGDNLILIHPCQVAGDDSGGVLFEFSGAKILERWGIEGYPFTRPSLCKAEYEIQKREVTLQSFFPPGECLLRRPRSVGDGFDLVDAASQLLGKRVFVLFALHSADRSKHSKNDLIVFDRVGKFIPILKCEYEAQVGDNVAEESKFEVVYFPTGWSTDKSSFHEFTKDMPWLVKPFSLGSDWLLLSKVFEPCGRGATSAVVFNEQGELIAKEAFFVKEKEGYTLQFPFIDQDLEKHIRREVEGLCPSVPCVNNHDLYTAIKQWGGSNDSDLSTAVKPWRAGLPFSRKDRYSVDEIGYNVDVADLLCTPERDFLIKNNGQKIKIDDLRGKTILLFIVPLDLCYSNSVEEIRPGAGDTWDMIDAYYELLRMGSDVEFVFVPIRFDNAGSVDDLLAQEALFDQLFSTMPFPSIPFADVQGPEDPVFHTFCVDVLSGVGLDMGDDNLPYWVVIDPSSTVVATRFYYCNLFKFFGGAELHPLSRQRIREVVTGNTRQSWDQLLASDTRYFLFSSNGDKVPISSLKGKLVGLYLCDSIPHPPRMEAIKKVYEEANARGYDFEIVQKTFHYHPFYSRHLGTDPWTVQQCREDVSWLTLPFKDPSCRKVQRILKWINAEEAERVRDRLVLIYPRQAEIEADDSSGVLFEFSGAKILKQWGIEGYPFTRPSLYKAQLEVQKREVTLQSLFPPRECLLWHPRYVGDGFDLVDAFSQLSGKRVLFYFAPHSGCNDQKGARICNFISMLKSEYEAQRADRVAKESKFEVVYVSTYFWDPSFNEFTKDMPWLVRPFSDESPWDLLLKVLKWNVGNACAAAFNEQGELVAKETDPTGEKKEGDRLRFPFIDQDLENFIRGEVERILEVYG